MTIEKRPTDARGPHRLAGQIDAGREPELSEAILDGGLNEHASPERAAKEGPQKIVLDIQELIRRGRLDDAAEQIALHSEESSGWEPPLNYCLEIEHAWCRHFRGDQSGSLELSRGLVNTLRNSPHVRELGLSQVVLGATLMALGKADEAIKAYSVALHVFDWQLPDKRSAMQVLNLIAISYRRLGKYALAEETLQRASDVAHELESGILIANARVNLAVVQLKRGRISKVRELLAYVLDVEAGSTESQRMRSNLIMAQLETLALSHEQSRLRLSIAFETLKKNPTSRDAILYREYASDALLGEGDPRGALKLLDKALIKARHYFPGSDLICEIQRRRATVLSAMGKLKDAILAADEAIIAARSVGEPYEHALAIRSQAVTTAATGNVDAAIELLKASESILDELGEVPERAIGVLALAKLLGSSGSFQSATQYLHDARRSFANMGFAAWVEQCDELLDGEMLEKRPKSSSPSTPTSPDLSRFGIITEDARVIQAFSALKQVAPSTLPVLIEGESGTGKELFARALHILSPRANEPFLPLNCGAISPDMQEAELFGHARGSFTGAVAERAGYFESANHGTLFLDEIGEMSLAMQTKLLRVLETGELCRVGDTRVRRIDVRHVAATNQDLNACVERRDFRLDLLQRLNGLRLSIPPLRERRGDIARLLEHFMALYAIDPSTPPRMTPGLMSKLVAYDWPGNVRELRLAVERAMILSSNAAWLSEDHFPFLDRESANSAAGTLTGDLADIEKVRLLAALEKARWSKSAAAKLLGLSRTTFNSKMQRYGIPFEAPERFRTPAR